MTQLNQRTVAQAITATGIGLHSGKKVTLTLKPAEPDTGIVFERTDLGASVPMQADLVVDTMMSSNLVQGDARVGTVEHLLSAVAACGLDNLIIQVDAAEIPIMDGSAAPFLFLIDQAGIQEQDAPKKFIKIIKPVEVGDGDKWARLEPYDNGFLMDFEIDFSHAAIAATEQSTRLDFNTANFAIEVGQARTFGFLKDLEYLQKNNLALGGSLDNAVVLDDDKVVNEGGLRYPNEFVRHKMLDAVGDLYVIGHQLLGKFSAYKSGHAVNNNLIRAVLADESSYEIVTFYDKDDCPIVYVDAGE
ncbi:UDP-3-O-acyl-N-acetylglucosamine deacetylase [Moraxella sp. FZFQ2102]|uniref:UDP-3-O-acyl-N-acetylglucosamine deacetylase n=1 Tax=Moraxella sp. FZFQ2102 TaxID=2953752 RepID=UPI00209C460A|nr:UDP-3-O-acyl-N-acetylglucosamine deacetylase [Moraxella sp. FZFQ2102]USZ14251.1 UDP-3-O-acyl-N-acetylglucosamine deacetylase [Moraxella sp. FZFQ2102]